MKNLLIALFCVCTFTLVAQENNKASSLDIDLAIGSSQGAAAVSYHYNWYLGKNKKFIIGTGVRGTAYLGSNQYYVTAPAQLTSGATGPGVIFKENIPANMDSFLIAKPMVFSINGLINLGYKFNEKLSVSFNIDAIGFSFGGKKEGTYINGAQGLTESAKPTAFNVLLISDNDRGSLNSVLGARYALNDKLALKGGVHFLFTEFTTDTSVQTLPEANDRFRNKSLMFMLGVSLNL
jgi:hypothetical protein